MNKAENMMKMQYELLDDSVRSDFQDAYTQLYRPIPNEEGLEQEFWIHKIPFAQEEQ